MRKSSPIDPLISKTMQGLLASTVMQPDRAWYLSDLAKRQGVRPSTLQSSLAALVKAGVLTRRREGNRVYYQADPACPFLLELQGLIGKTVGLVDVLRDAVARFRKRITVAFIHGSIARSAENSASDVDLVVIGTLGLEDISHALMKAEAKLNRPVNARVYTPGEFAEKLAARNHFLTTLLNKEKTFILGGNDELEEVAGNKPRPNA